VSRRRDRQESDPFLQLLEPALNSSYGASNGSKEKPNHSIFNSFPLSNFHQQFLES
jgi:hypothetical protein